MANVTCLSRNYRTWNDLSGGEDLSVNTEGIGVIHELMERMHEMQQELKQLRREVRLLRTNYLEEIL